MNLASAGSLPRDDRRQRSVGGPRPAAPKSPESAQPSAQTLPRWPVTAAFALYPVWWFLGLLDLILVPLAVVMLLHLVRARDVRVPRGWGVWALFVLWAGCSVIMLDELGAFIGFTYRYLLLLASTVLFVYVYNARRHLNDRYLLGLMTGVWVTVVVGGYLAILFPDTTWRTPMAYVLDVVKAAAPGSSIVFNNDLVIQMVIRRFAQYNVTSTLDLAPRPAAPFRYTNNWGNVYSLLLPLVVAYALRASARRRLLIWTLLPLSAVPALLTLNRGMMLGILVAVLYLAVRALLNGRPTLFMATILATLVAVGLFFALPIQERLDNRLGEGASSTETRSSVYQQALASVPDSPFFGYGTPLEGTNPTAPPVGTQGQVWIILVSHGALALAAALGWLVSVIVRTRRRWDAVGLAAHTAVLVGTMELFYYGAVPYGLPLLLCAAALALRAPTGAVLAPGAGR